MKRKKSQSGSTREQLTIPGMEQLLSSVDSGGLRRALGKNTYDPSWDLTKPENHG